MKHSADFGRGHHLALVDRRLKTSDVFDGDAVGLARPQELVESGKNLIIENLEFADAVDQPLDRDVGHRLILAVNSLNAEDVVAG